MEKTHLGTDKDGRDIYSYEISNSKGMRAKLMNYGANLLELHVMDCDGEYRDVVLGYKNLEDYFTNGTFFGCCVAPSANRIGEARFELNGVEYKLDVNDGPNNLHSGFDPLSHRIWEVKDVSADSVTFTYDKRDMDMGFPGNMLIEVKYTVTEDDGLRIDYMGCSDKDTVFNPTNHSYFNLRGHDAGEALNQKVWINALSFTETDERSIPNGNLVEVKGTPMDFTVERALSEDIDADYEQLRWAGGYDHNYVLNGDEGELRLAATMCDEESGIKMEVCTDLPGLQLYAGNYIPDGELVGKSGSRYVRRSGIAFESQYHPNAINIPSFSQPVIKANEEKRTTTIYRFTCV